MPLLVWLYWEDQCQDWIRACQKTISDHALDFQLLGPDEFNRLWVRDRAIDVSRLYTAHRVDFIRAYLLSRAVEGRDTPVPDRRSSVGTSNWQKIPLCVEAMLDIAPMRVLDIGFGDLGFLVREFCDEWKGRMYRENWSVHLEGIENFSEEYRGTPPPLLQLGPRG